MTPGRPSDSAHPVSIEAAGRSKPPQWRWTEPVTALRPGTGPIRACKNSVGGRASCSLSHDSRAFGSEHAASIRGGPFAGVRLEYELRNSSAHRMTRQ